MDFTTNDVAPVGGIYKVLTADGTVIGQLILDAGAVFPPSAIPSHYFSGPF